MEVHRVPVPGSNNKDTKNLTMRSVRVKSRVKEIDTGILNAAMQRRRDDASETLVLPSTKQQWLG
jgi:hypothetical protein